jgi:predicted AlkP superfamily pyrophosphatase or phosphodiesterase
MKTVLMISTLLLVSVYGPAAPRETSAGERRPLPELTAKSLLDHQYPRLVVVLVFDQLRQDYLARFSHQYLPAMDAAGKPGGFRYLQEKGAHFADAHFTHIPTFTGPGHSVILTGAPLGSTGIIANDWITSGGGKINCVDDSEAVAVGEETTKTGSSPVNLLASTVGDELKLATGNQSKVVGLAIKNRGAILLAGHNPDAAVWFDSDTGSFISSTYYAKSGLPKFAARANSERVADRWVGKAWELLLPRDQYPFAHREHVEGQGDGRQLGWGFPKKLGDRPGKVYWDKMTFSPYGNEMLFETAKMAVQDEGLGQDAIPDLLGCSFSSNDLAGHSYGPHSTEVQDFTLRTDRQLADFFGFLQSSVEGGLDNVVIVLTSDHGVAPLPEWAAESCKLHSGRILYDAVAKAARRAVAKQFPEVPNADKLVYGYAEPYIYLNKEMFEELRLDIFTARRRVAEEIRMLEGVHSVYTRDQIENNMLPPSRVGESITNGFHATRSGDVVVTAEPFWYSSSGPLGCTHSSAYTYDTHVPVLFSGKFIQPGTYAGRVTVNDIAPTLSLLIGCEQPSSSQGRILTEMLR